MILERVVVTDPGQLFEMDRLVHDAYADLDHVAFDQASAEVRLSFAQEIDTWRELADAPVRRTTAWKRRSWWPSVRLVIPFLQVDLTIRRARSMWLGPPERLQDPWSLNEFRYDERGGRLTLEPVVGPDLIVEVEELHLDGAISDHVALIVERRVGLIGETDSSRGDLRLLPRHE